MRRVAPTAFLLLAGIPAFAQQVSLTKTVRSGSSARLGSERAWNRSCATLASEVTITQQPDHGTVSILQSASAIPASTARSGSTGACAGRTVAGREVVYRPQPGFHGGNRVSWSVVYGNGGGGNTSVAIDVR